MNRAALLRREGYMSEATKRLCDFIRALPASESVKRVLLGDVVEARKDARIVGGKEGFEKAREMAAEVAERDWDNPDVAGAIRAMRDEAGGAMSTEPLSAWRYRLTVREATVRTARSEAEGVAFRACREACGLSRSDVAAGWGVEVGTIHAIDGGWLAFPERADLQAAISQFWCWANERRNP
jgi:hypothetical protein